MFDRFTSFVILNLIIDQQFTDPTDIGYRNPYNSDPLTRFNVISLVVS